MTTDTDALLATVREALLYNWDRGAVKDAGYAALDSLAAELRQALARAEAAEAFIRKMDMSYRYEEFRENG